MPSRRWCAAESISPPRRESTLMVCGSGTRRSKRARPSPRETCTYARSTGQARSLTTPPVLQAATLRIQGCNPTQPRLQRLRIQGCNPTYLRLQTLRTRGCNPKHPRLQPYAAEAATFTHPRLQPYLPQAATLRTRGCNLCASEAATLCTPRMQPLRAPGCNPMYPRLQPYVSQAFSVMSALKGLPAHESRQCFVKTPYVPTPDLERS